MNRIIYSVLSLLVVFSISANGQAKLKIGIKKRVEDCPLKTKRGHLVHIHYTGTLEDGTVFDSSISRGQPISFTLGMDEVIKGWDQGLLGMCEGEKRKLTIPPELGYGAAGAGDAIPPNSVLIFETELIKIERRDDL